MRNIINNKFEGIKQKWIKIPIKADEISIINKSIVSSINSNVISKEDALNLFKSFKKHGFVWAKYNKTSGRRNLTCKCQIMTARNKKIDFFINPERLLSFNLLNGTPKSLKLYDMKKDEIIEDPKDGFDDGIYPPAWMEFTALGYEEYKIEYYEKKKLSMIKK